MPLRADGRLRRQPGMAEPRTDTMVRSAMADRVVIGLHNSQQAKYLGES